jgi:serine/threonine-protein kinase
MVMTERKPISRQYGPYRVVGMLEASADSALYHALHSRTGRMVMLRVLTIHKDAKNPEKMQQMKHDCLYEIETVRAIQHPHLLPIEDVGESEFHVFYAMPIKQGGTLGLRLYGPGDVYLESDNPLPKLPSLGETGELLRQVGSALQTLHDHRVVHGQIEPRSILTDGTTSFLADAGLLKLYKIIFRLDTTNSFSVTRYTAPEVWDAERPTAASDQYALACITYELITGRAPFESNTILGLMQSHTQEAVIPPNYVRPDLKIPAELSMIFWQALAKPPDQRFSSVKAFVDAFNTTIRGREGTPTDFFTMNVSFS